MMPYRYQVKWRPLAGMSRYNAIAEFNSYDEAYGKFDSLRIDNDVTHVELIVVSDRTGSLPHTLQISKQKGKSWR
jgi:hypothetical protein